MIASAVFIALNPFMTAHPAGPLPPSLQAISEMNPWQRFRLLVAHRGELSAQQQKLFPHDALHTFSDRASVVLVQGFGRFGPFGPRKSDSTRRFDLRQDWGAVVWLPLVLAGAVAAGRLGWQQQRQSRAPTGWALLIWWSWPCWSSRLTFPWPGIAISCRSSRLPPCSRRCFWPAQTRSNLDGSFVPEVLMRSPWKRVEWSVFFLLLGSYAFFWHSRDWNTASRLILTYAMADRGTVCLDGLERQTGDIAFFQSHYYCDKFPGFSLVALAPYSLRRPSSACRPTRCRPEAKDYWPADYWITLGTSGLFTAITAVLLVRLARDLGCSPRRGALVGLAYGLTTPAYVYATLAYGHQLAAFALTASLWLIWRHDEGREASRLIAAGFLAAYAAVIELQVGPVSAILGIYLLVQCLGHHRKPDALAYFALGAAVPDPDLADLQHPRVRLPLEMGYVHHATAQFAKVHNRQNPLGLTMPDLTRSSPALG